jgi:DNA replication licensing factor MCM3
MSFLDESIPQDDQLRDRTRVLEEFLSSDSDIYNYKDDIARMLRNDQTRLIVNIDDLRDYNREYAESALANVIEQAQGQEAKQDLADKTFRIGFSGSFGDLHVSPRTLHAAQLGKMISLEGIITRCSLVRPKMLKSVHYCPETQIFHSREYRDATTSTSNQPPTSSVTPQTDDEGHQLQTEYGFCTFRDHQRISIQEMPERAPAGQLPRSTDIILDGDLVDKCKPGDRIQLVGVYQSIGGGSGGAFKCVLLLDYIICRTERLTDL